MTVFLGFVCDTVAILLYVMGILILIRAVLGLFVTEEDGVFLYNFCFAATEPVVYPVRSLLSKVSVLAESGLDLSYFTSFLVILIVLQLLPVPSF